MVTAGSSCACSSAGAGGRGDNIKNWDPQDLEAWRRDSGTVRLRPLRKGCWLAGASISEAEL